MHLFAVIIKWPQQLISHLIVRSNQMWSDGDQMTNIRRVCHGSCVSLAPHVLPLLYLWSVPIVFDLFIYLFILRPLSVDVRSRRLETVFGVCRVGDRRVKYTAPDRWRVLCCKNQTRPHSLHTFCATFFNVVAVLLRLFLGRSASSIFLLLIHIIMAAVAVVVIPMTTTTTVKSLLSSRLPAADTKDRTRWLRR